MAPRLVRDIMTTRIATVGPEARLETIAQAFERHPFHHVPIVAEGRVVGIVSDRDLIRAYTGHSFDGAKPVSSIMTRLVASISADATIHEASQRLMKLGVNSLLILDDGKLEGIVTSRDIVKAVAEGGA